MPFTNSYGDANSPATKAIGGVPTITYFDFQSRGRAQVVRLMWEDAGIAYNDTRFPFSEYPSFKETELPKLNPLATIPVVEINGQILTQSYAMLRRFARQLGKYGMGEANTEEERYWADAMCDVAADWRSKFVNAFFGPNPDKDYPEHQKTARVTFLKGIEEQLSTNSLSQRGPYVIGKEISYADLVIYQVCHDENLTQEGRKGLRDYPRLVKLVDAVEARENVKAFMGSERYKG